MARAKTARGKPLNAQLRRKLSEEGKRLLRHALAHEDDLTDKASVDFSVVTNRDDESVDSELESVLQFEQEQQLMLAARGKAAAATKRGKKWKGSDAFGNEGVPELDEALEELAEKRDTTKIAALRKILSLMCSQVLTNSVETFRAPLTTQALACLKRRMKESGPLALRSLAVLAVTIGADALDYFEDILMPVQRALTDEGDVALRVEAAYALSVACFVCCPDEQHTWDTLEVLGGFLTAAKEAEHDDDDAFPEELVIAVMECWAFLVSSFPAEVVAPSMSDNSSSILSDHIAAIAGYVRDGMQPSVRSAACEVLALLVQLKYMASSDGDGDEAYSGGWSYADEPADSVIGGLEQKIAAYMRETGKQIGKKNRKQQRSTLKDVLETLQTGEGPHSELQIEDEMMSVSTWDRFFQAHVFRRALQSGFQTHLLENSVLREVFDVTDTTKTSMVSTVKRRADHKSKAIHKRNDMSRKGMAQNAFLYED